MKIIQKVKKGKGKVQIGGQLSFERKVARIQAEPKPKKTYTGQRGFSEISPGKEIIPAISAGASKKIQEKFELVLGVGLPEAKDIKENECHVFYMDGKLESKSSRIGVIFKKPSGKFNNRTRKSRDEDTLIYAYIDPKTLRHSGQLPDHFSLDAGDVKSLTSVLDQLEQAPTEEPIIDEPVMELVENNQNSDSENVQKSEPTKSLEENKIKIKNSKEKLDLTDELKNLSRKFKKALHIKKHKKSKPTAESQNSQTTGVLAKNLSDYLREVDEKIDSFELYREFRRTSLQEKLNTIERLEKEVSETISNKSDATTINVRNGKILRLKMDEVPRAYIAAKNEVYANKREIALLESAAKILEEIKVKLLNRIQYSLPNDRAQSVVIDLTNEFSINQVNTIDKLLNKINTRIKTISAPETPTKELVAKIEKHADNRLTQDYRTQWEKGDFHYHGSHLEHLAVVDIPKGVVDNNEYHSFPFKAPSTIVSPQVISAPQVSVIKSSSEPIPPGKNEVNTPSNNDKERSASTEVPNKYDNQADLRAMDIPEKDAQTPSTAGSDKYENQNALKEMNIPETEVQHNIELPVEEPHGTPKSRNINKHENEEEVAVVEYDGEQYEITKDNIKFFISQYEKYISVIENYSFSYNYSIPYLYRVGAKLKQLYKIFHAIKHDQDTISNILSHDKKLNTQIESIFTQKSIDRLISIGQGSIFELQSSHAYLLGNAIKSPYEIVKTEGTIEIANKKLDVIYDIFATNIDISKTDKINLWEKGSVDSLIFQVYHLLNNTSSVDVFRKSITPLLQKIINFGPNDDLNQKLTKIFTLRANFAHAEFVDYIFSNEKMMNILQSNGTANEECIDLLLRHIDWLIEHSTSTYKFDKENNSIKEKLTPLDKFNQEIDSVRTKLASFKESTYLQQKIPQKIKTLVADKQKSLHHKYQGGSDLLQQENFRVQCIDESLQLLGDLSNNQQYITNLSQQQDNLQKEYEVTMKASELSRNPQHYAAEIDKLNEQLTQIKPELQFYKNRQKAEIINPIVNNKNTVLPDATNNNLEKQLKQQLSQFKEQHESLSIQLKNFNQLRKSLKSKADDSIAKANQAIKNFEKQESGLFNKFLRIFDHWKKPYESELQQIKEKYLATVKTQAASIVEINTKISQCERQIIECEKSIKSCENKLQAKQPAKNSSRFAASVSKASNNTSSLWNHKSQSTQKETNPATFVVPADSQIKSTNPS